MPSTQHDQSQNLSYHRMHRTLQVYYAATGASHMNPVPGLLRHLKSVKTPLSEHKKGR
jgi:hypothetical protein